MAREDISRVALFYRGTIEGVSVVVFCNSELDVVRLANCESFHDMTPIDPSELPSEDNSGKCYLPAVAELMIPKDHGYCKALTALSADLPSA